MATPIKVAVRVRPLNKSEVEEGANSIVSVDPRVKQCTITNPTSGEAKAFTFDHIYDSSINESSPMYASQQTLWTDLGDDLLEAAWAGYNYSLFAYGQTGSGKSYSMLGFGQDNEKKGILPRACEAIFEKMARCEQEGNPADGQNISFTVEASMLEIYNEKVRDLFVPLQKQQRKGLRIRDSPKTGAYVEGLKKVPVSSSNQIKRLLEFGTKQRTLAATNMNETSSRAHTIFTITFVTRKVEPVTMKATSKTSQINLVDLAGSERIAKTGAEGDRLTEGQHINRSLSALGNVINALASNSSRKKQSVVPYRDAALTHLLKSSLGGNAKTTMIASVSPADINFAESLSTLRYANRTKQIKNIAVVNEDPNDRLIRHLREEMEGLRQQLQNSTGLGTKQREELRAEMETTFHLEMEKKRAEWEQHERDYQALLSREGGGDVPPTTPHLSNLNEDAALTGVLKFFLEDNCDYVVVSSDNRTDEAENLIVLGGMGIMPRHAVIRRRARGPDGYGNCELTLTSFSGARTLINGIHLSADEDRFLNHGDRIMFGNNSNIYIVVIPSEDQGPEDIDFDWEASMKEANAAVMDGLAADNKKKYEAAEQEKRLMEQRIKELEMHLINERRRASQDTMKQEELQEQLEKQIIESEKFSKRQERERKERSLMDRQLLHALPLVHEANSISAALKKGMKFSAKLVSRMVYSGIDSQATYSTEVCIHTTTTSPREHRSTSSMPIDRQSLWSLEKFNARVYIMRDMYSVWMDKGTLTGTEFDNKDTDPFIPEDQLVGTCLIQLEALRYMLDIQEHTPIVDYAGRSQGELEVMLFPSLVGCADTDVSDDLQDVAGKGRIDIVVDVKSARGLSKTVVASHEYIYVKWKLITSDWYKSDKTTLQSMNPTISHKAKVTANVTNELCTFISAAAMCIEVWASVEGPHDGRDARSQTTEALDEMVEVPETIPSDEADELACLKTENQALEKQNAELSTKLSEALQQIEVLEQSLLKQRQTKAVVSPRKATSNESSGNWC